jgi:3-oxoacyl-[acyl-carrier-protein] synthase II
MTRVFVTGMGAITPIGNDVPTFWSNLLDGVCGASKISGFDTDDMPHNIACEVKGFDPKQYMEHKTARRLHRSAQFAVAVARQALADARLTVDESNWERVGVLMATGGGGITEIESGALDVVQKGWRSSVPSSCPARWPTR